MDELKDKVMDVLSSPSQRKFESFIKGTHTVLEEGEFTKFELSTIHERLKDIITRKLQNRRRLQKGGELTAEWATSAKEEKEHKLAEKEANKEARMLKKIANQEKKEQKAAWVAWRKNSLLDILASAPPNTNKWTSLSSDLALQIVRSTSAPLSELPAFEKRVGSHISNACSPVYQEAEKVILSQLYRRLKMLVEAYMPLSNLQVSDAATSPRKANGIVSHIPVDVPADKEPIIDMATRVAHIGVLHWRVWGPLAYIDDPEGTSDMGDDEGESSDQTSNRHRHICMMGLGRLVVVQ
ncbi:hypothetical protein F5884DRAFT_890438 [Xylogone sp. PMI_703]|nr:hypothetical protein F5884DRAFT_890438 [Xylogone sp. PMI_703]